MTRGQISQTGQRQHDSEEKREERGIMKVENVCASKTPGREGQPQPGRLRDTPV